MRGVADWRPAGKGSEARSAGTAGAVQARVQVRTRHAVRAAPLVVVVATAAAGRSPRSSSHA
jgi:hypothetical protein